jgi:hypothetical protein
VNSRDDADRKRMEELVLNRRGAEADSELKAIAAKYVGVQGVNNIGTTEIVTTKVPPADILGYFEIRDTKGKITISLYTELKDLAESERCRVCLQGSATWAVFHQVTKRLHCGKVQREDTPPLGDLLHVGMV